MSRKIVIPLLFLIAIAGCTGKTEDPNVATANPGVIRSSGAAAKADRSPLAYSQCMRAQGLTWFPDPDAQGRLKVSTPDDADPKKVEAAEQACRKYAPWEGPGDPIPADELAKLRQVAQCMRDHGFTNWPDPNADGSTRVDSRKLGVEADDPKVREAQEDCQKYAPTPRGRTGS
ncbi:hypothetical protein [Actinoplanes sp. HUAS TT8]|uniref:hypothetical protein n=1 Tax=Actinoplanes sp. HUAS TT8 TaxID=3447453 RepID=UPI003F528DAB